MAFVLVAVASILDRKSRRARLTQRSRNEHNARRKQRFVLEFACQTARHFGAKTQMVVRLFVAATDGPIK